MTRPHDRSATHAELVDRCKRLGEDALLARANAWFAQRMSEVTYLSILDHMAALGTARDQSSCPECGGQASPLGASGLCDGCVVVRATRTKDERRRRRATRKLA